MSEQTIRKVLGDHARLSVDAASIAVGADLYELGLTSHASVNVMLALEDSFDTEFPGAAHPRQPAERPGAPRLPACRRDARAHR
ncbi:acyl carrier protein [Rhodococcus opacus]|uniref:acyl carrier protein n=1 Tax=Rhodococcus opacus TaxID=37919 RepID=UPI001F5464EA|nr:acyl carrier protein [Rhodococcus opacus]